MADVRFFAPAAPLTLAEVAALSGAVLSDTSVGARVMTGVAPLRVAGAGDIGFVTGRKFLGDLATTRAGAVFVPADLAVPGAPCPLLHVRDPKAAWVTLAARLHPAPEPVVGVHPGAHVDAGARIGAGCEVGAGVVITAGAEVGAGSILGSNVVVGPGVVIGPGARIGAGVTITHAILGAGVILHPGVRIGQDGFGFVPGPRGAVKVPQLGRVLIGDDVEIGANAAIDRGTGEDTEIGAGTKIDNLVHIAHNVKVGRHCFILTQTGIAGGSVVGDGVMIGGQVAIRDHVTIGSGAQIASQSGVSKDIPAGAIVSGSPAVDMRQWRREVAALRRLAKGRGD